MEVVFGAHKRGTRSRLNDEDTPLLLSVASKYPVNLAWLLVSTICTRATVGHSRHDPFDSEREWRARGRPWSFVHHQHRQESPSCTASDAESLLHRLVSTTRKAVSSFVERRKRRIVGDTEIHPLIASVLWAAVALMIEQVLRRCRHTPTTPSQPTQDAGAPRPASAEAFEMLLTLVYSVLSVQPSAIAILSAWSSEFLLHDHAATQRLDSLVPQQHLASSRVLASAVTRAHHETDDAEAEVQVAHAFVMLSVVARAQQRAATLPPALVPEWLELSLASFVFTLEYDRSRQQQQRAAAAANAAEGRRVGDWIAMAITQQFRSLAADAARGVEERVPATHRAHSLLLKWRSLRASTADISSSSSTNSNAAPRRLW